MKRMVICTILCLVMLCGCTFEPSSLNDFENEKAYEVGYEKGVQYVLSTLRENADDWNYYMNIEDIEDSIRIYYRSDNSIDVDEARDAIIYHPDFERYTLAELLEKLIEENIEE